MPAINIGGYEMEECPLISCWPDTRFYGVRPVIGSFAFLGHVLTVDHQKREIVIRDAGYDLTRAPVRPGAAVVDFRLAAGGDFGTGVPTMAGTIAGLPASITLDTGSGSFAVVDPALVRAIKMKYPEKRPRPDPSPSHPSREYMDAVNWSVGGLHATDDITLEPRSNVRMLRVLLGQPALERYRVTIDYARRKVLFEPILWPDRLPSDDHSWAAQPWIGDDAPYRSLRRAVDQEAARGASRLDLLVEYDLAARQHPGDTKAVYQWGYVALLASQGCTYPITTLTPAYNAMASVSSPLCPEFDRVRFLLAATGRPAGKGYLVGVGQRLIAHNPQDGDVRSYLVNILDVTTDPAQKRLALSYVQDADWPASERWLAALMRGSVYWRCWRHRPNSQDAQGALAAYQEYLRLGRPNDPRRQTAAEAINTLSQQPIMRQAHGSAP